MITIRKATVDDIEPIFELNKKNILDYENIDQIDLGKILVWVKNKITKNISNYNSIYLDDIKVGYYHLFEADGKLELGDLYIFDHYQKQGIGTMIMNNVTQKAKELDKDIFLYVFLRNEGAIKLYKKFGFEIIENIKESRYVMEFKV